MSDTPDMIYAYTDGDSEGVWDTSIINQDWGYRKYLSESIAITKEDHQKAMIELLDEAYSLLLSDKNLRGCETINSLKQRTKEKSDE